MVVNKDTECVDVLELRRLSSRVTHHLPYRRRPLRVRADEALEIVHRLRVGKDASNSEEKWVRKHAIQVLLVRRNILQVAVEHLAHGIHPGLVLKAGPKVGVHLGHCVHAKAVKAVLRLQRLHPVDECAANELAVLIQIRQVRKATNCAQASGATPSPLGQDSPSTCGWLLKSTISHSGW